MGAVKRNKLEKDDSQISYETFVDELDEGDAFTATLIDVLVNVCDPFPEGAPVC